MNRIWIAFLMLALTATAQSPLGTYLGELQVPGARLRVGLVVSSPSAGSFRMELISIDQGNSKMEASSASVEGNLIKFQIGAARVNFEGTLSEDGQSIAGKFTQGMTFDINFKRVTELPRLARSQEPKPPFPYTAEDITFTGGADGVTLAGTLTLPKAAGKSGAVVLVSGSGPQNRDEEIVGHKPFWLWADRLTRAGFIVLRYDDRGVGKSTGTYKGATTADFALDTKAALAYLRTRKEVDATKVIIMGHSEGGLIAPIVASEDPKLAGIVLLAAPGVTGEAILRRQVPDLVKAAGAAESIAATQLEGIARQAETDPWMKFFWNHDPAPVLQKVKCPVLALNGELDMQVNADINLAAIEAALQAGGNKSYKASKLPKLNHLFQTAITGAGQEYVKIDETLAPAVMDEVTAWLKQTLATK